MGVYSLLESAGGLIMSGYHKPELKVLKVLTPDTTAESAGQPGAIPRLRDLIGGRHSLWKVRGARYQLCVIIKRAAIETRDTRALKV